MRPLDISAAQAIQKSLASLATALNFSEHRETVVGVAFHKATPLLHAVTVCVIIHTSNAGVA